MKTKSILLFCLFIIIALIIFLLWWWWWKPQPQPNQSFNIKVSYTPPFDVDSNATEKQLVEFAWEEFLALNWKADTTGMQRDVPNTQWNYSQDDPSLVVWETYAHKTELRPYSDVMEPFNTLPPNYSIGVPLQQDSSQSPLPTQNHFHFLDEANEIGSCNVYGRFNTYNTNYQVLYQAKVNKDEYNYIYGNFPTKAKLAIARQHTLYQLNTFNAYLPNVPNSCDCDSNQLKESGIIRLPCGNAATKTVGAIEVKTGWRQLTPLDDPTKFFTRTVIVPSRKIQGSDTIYSYSNKIYALIGLHIIHKTKNNEDFVFATWEQKDVQKDNMAYQLLDSNGNPMGKDSVNYQRLHPISPMADSSTNYVHKNILSKKSVWQNYRLVGVQGGLSNPANIATTAPSFFLANYVVESDSTLANFHGSGFQHPHDTLPNTLYRGQRLSLGGCQGCHGVAQQKIGTDFSFLLDSVGKPEYSPDIAIANDAPQMLRRDPNLKLLRYRNLLQAEQKK